MTLFDKRAASVLSTILLFIAAGAFVYEAGQILLVFLLAILFAYLLEPMVSRFRLWRFVSRGSRNLAILEVYVVLCAALAVIVFLAGPPIVEEGKTLATALPGLFDKLSSGQLAVEIGSGRGWSYATQMRLQQFLTSHSSAILGWVSSQADRVAAAAQNVVWIALIPILATFFLKDGRRFVESVLAMFERRQQKRFLSGILSDLNEMLAHYIRSQLILTGLSLVFYMTALSILRVPYALAVGSAAGVMEFIPLLGPLVGAAAILGVAFLANYHHLLVVALLLGGWRVLQDYFTSPHIMGENLDLHPLTIIFAVLVGGEIAGVIGIYLSIPIAATLRIMWKRWDAYASGGRP